MKSPQRWILVGTLLVLGAFAIHGCGDDEKNPVTPPTGADVTIDIVADMGSTAYGAAPTTITSGQTVSWRNTRGTNHTATQTGGGFNTGTIAPGATSIPIAISTTGDLAYECNFHPTMTGTLHVDP